MIHTRPGEVSLSVPIRYDGDTVVVEIRGELDLATAPLLRDTLGQLIAEGALAILVDAGELEFVDTKGLSALVDAAGELIARGGELSVANVRPAARRLLELTRADWVLAPEEELGVPRI